MPNLQSFLKNTVEASALYIIESRRHLHAIPELGFEEKKTSAFIGDELLKWGYAPLTGIAGTGLTADLKFGEPGPCLLIRADMDALPVQEATGLPFASTHPGRMHACGHDGHSAMLLGAARVMAELAASRYAGSLRGSIRFLFQPAEEAPGGALPMIRSGVLEGVDSCLAAHIWPQVAEGCVGVRPGPLMAATDRFEITLTGLGGHSSQPHLCSNALNAAAALALALQAEAPARINPVLPVTLSVCRLEAGHTYNVIPQAAYLSGCTRAFHREACSAWERTITGIVGGVASVYGVDYELDYRRGHGPVDNNPAVSALVAEAAALAVGWENVVEPELSLAGEDFSCFQEEVPGCMFFLGAGREGAKPLHSPEFSFNEEILATGCKVFCLSAIKILGAE